MLFALFRWLTKGSDKRIENVASRKVAPVSPYRFIAQRAQTQYSQREGAKSIDLDGALYLAQVTLKKADGRVQRESKREEKEIHPPEYYFSKEYEAREKAYYKTRDSFGLGAKEITGTDTIDRTSNGERRVVTRRTMREEPEQEIVKADRSRGMER